ncbi:AhpC/TSA family protein [Rhizobium subbaraonis]|uniref:AhpC/TSA family protein n=1 Tax=Rhizobium subbaraonis TaxID=908946 RepID=A0A285V1P8_9HYPH|nr:redoxin domain-containing protein [Rhizobium subbaraonis]SOC48095.1 AhpC/TSA family protein [Rhizobium subbaraonis]
MSIHIGDVGPNFTADRTTGTLDFHEWVGGDWVFFFSHPGDFTPVCTTEIGRTAQLAESPTLRLYCLFRAFRPLSFKYIEISLGSS